MGPTRLMRRERCGAGLSASVEVPVKPNPDGFSGYLTGMGLLRSAAVIGIAKVVYDQARKPENQDRLRAVIAQAKSARTRNSGTARERHP